MWHLQESFCTDKVKRYQLATKGSRDVCAVVLSNIECAVGLEQKQGIRRIKWRVSRDDPAGESIINTIRSYEALLLDTIPQSTLESSRLYEYGTALPGNHFSFDTIVPRERQSDLDLFVSLSMGCQRDKSVYDIVPSHSTNYTIVVRFEASLCLETNSWSYAIYLNTVVLP